jgi:hypothetical protein
VTGQEGPLGQRLALLESLGTQFTCFTGTKVQTLTLKRQRLALLESLGTQFTCFTGTKVQILTQNGRLVGESALNSSLADEGGDLGLFCKVRNFLALPVQTYKY